MYSIKRLIVAVLACAFVGVSFASGPREDLVDDIQQAVDKYIESVLQDGPTEPPLLKEPPIFVEWWYHSPVDLGDLPTAKPDDPSSYIHVVPSDGSLRYEPMPQPEGAHGVGFGGWKSWTMIEIMRQQAENGDPVVMLFRERNSPFPYNDKGHPVAPDAIHNALNNISKLDYLFMDLEGDHEMVEKNVLAIVDAVRSHPNPEVSNARIGNYNDYAGDYTDGAIWPNQKDRGGESWERGQFYLRSGMDVSMPVMYPYQVYSVHTNERYAENPSWNNRAALLWAPLEHFSVAARNLPEGHVIIPWVGNYVPYHGASTLYNAEAPPEEDLKAMIAHVYLRGAQGLSVWLSDKGRTQHPTVDYEEYKSLVLRVWREMDNAFEGEDIVEVLNLENSKESGVQWSAARSKSKIVVFVSNLSGTRTNASIPLPEGFGLPERTPNVADGSHAVFTFPY